VTRRNRLSSTGAVELSRAFRIWPAIPDQVWLDYQQEIALRHTSLKKNQVDRVQSTPHVPLRDIIAFIPVMNETIKPYLTAKCHPAGEVEKMHRAWCKSLQLQIALWTGLYAKLTPTEW
jgi:Protoglobin